MTEKDIQNLKNIEFHEKNGVKIPYHQGVIIEENVTIGAGTEILPGTMVFSGVIIGENCVIGDEKADNSGFESQYCSGGISLIGGGIEISDGVKIGVNSMVTESVIGKGEN